MATPTFFSKIKFSQIKSESRRSSGDAREKCGSTSMNKFYDSKNNGIYRINSCKNKLVLCRGPTSMIFSLIIIQLKNMLDIDRLWSILYLYYSLTLFSMETHFDLLLKYTYFFLYLFDYFFYSYFGCSISWLFLGIPWSSYRLS